MVKKIFMGIMVLLFIFTSVVKTDAAELTKDGQTANVPVRYTVDNTEFIIAVPAVIAADPYGTQFLVRASNVNLRPDQHLEVKITKGSGKDGEVVLERQNVPFGKPVASLVTNMSISGKGIDQNGNVVGYFEDSINSDQNITGEVRLSPLLVTDQTEAGDYEAIVEFTVTLINE